MTMVWRIGASVVLALVLSAAGAAVVEARQTHARQQAADLTHELMSPFCPGKLLADCTSPDAGELRQAIARRLEAGEPFDAVKADLVRQYGREILGAPEPRGLGLLVWLVPGLIAIVSAAGIARKVTNAARTAAASGTLAPVGAVDPAALAELDEELRDLD